MQRLSFVKVLLLTLAFILILTVFRLAWSAHFDSWRSSEGQDGKLDLTTQPISDQEVILLEGEWRFYPNELVDPGLPFEELSRGQVALGQGSWDLGSGEVNGVGTYAMEIRLPKEAIQPLSFYVTEINSASRLYVDGKLMYESGTVSESAKQYEAGERPDIVTFMPSESGVFTVVVQVANFDNPLTGGLVTPLRLGSVEAISQQRYITVGLTILASTIYFLHALYGLFLYIMARKVERDIRWLYFSLILFLLTIATLLTERILLMVGAVTFDGHHRIINVGVLLGAYCLTQLLKTQRPRIAGTNWFQGYSLLLLGTLVFSLVAPVSWIMHSHFVVSLLAFIPFIPAINIFFRYVRRVKTDALFLYFGLVAAGTSFLWLIVIERFHLDRMTYPFDLLISLFCIILYFYRQYFRVLQKKTQAIEELHQVNEEKDAFLLMAANELRTPVQTITNLTSSIIHQNNTSLSDKSMDELYLMDAVTRRVSLIIQDILELERLDDSKIELNFMAVKLNPLVQSVLDMSRHLINEESIQLVNDVSEDLPYVRADERRLHQILYNLVHNAIQFTERGVVRVTAKRLGDQVLIAVSDEGSGITSDDLPRIFEPYQKGKSGEAPWKDGLGLGLSIVKRLVALHNSAIVVNSKIGTGSVFSFTLQNWQGIIPAVTREDLPLIQKKEITTKAQLKQVKKRILVVDDQYSNLRLLESMFSPQEFSVSLVESGREALDCIAQEPFDLVITDNAMPRMSGLELTKKIRQKYALFELPVLVVTTISHEESSKAVFASGANDYIIRPINPIELVSRSNSLLQTKQAMEERLTLEAAWLHAQIKPHFLINTFLSIAALGRIDIDRMDDLIGELSTYIRLSIDVQNEQGLSSLDRELRLVRAYLAIQKERFGDRVQVVWEVDVIQQVQIPPLTLQSIVENAVSHGVLSQMDGGTIRIQINQLKNSVKFSVEDDGIGMTDEKLRSLFHDTNAKQGWRKGVGLSNTNRRLKQRYNKGLVIESIQGVGTTVSFEIPIN